MNSTEPYVSGFDECPKCGTFVLTTEECPICDDDQKKHRPKKPEWTVKRDPKRLDKSRRRKHHNGT